MSRKNFKFAAVVGTNIKKIQNLTRIERKALAKKNMQLVIGSMDDYVKDFVGHSIDKINKK